ncbi:pyridoxamine 5'-phosphate oxidase family protein [Fusibacter paucivorans]|uniref:Pyridoxamine 5'-phosphate oxidase family protein n=1 Tax=Fusibacter paucivorans TaxID=76009 RepID=A0ABS5PMB6_9FIRM|nr:pyridoxamine 5'-phosphate oxidase family protein [Fusibacter paucivorans]MBS7526203.1 pyridoxamine 5'-phosphate oxidase family protein [Fusibacter paucivorans]
MKEVLTYLQNCGTFYLATMDGETPRVRPFGAVAEYDGKLYIVTNNQKKVFAQMKHHPKVEISGMYQGTWIRLEAEAIHDERREARVAMMTANEKVLSSMYHVDDQLMEVFYLQNATADFCAFSGETKRMTF